VRDTEELDRVFANANSFHMGIEYVLESDHIKVPWRLGFFNNPEQKYEYTETGEQGDQVSSHYITGGIGFLTRQFKLDISAAYQILQYQTDFNQYHVYENEDKKGVPFPVEFNRSRIRVTAGLQIIL
jgi:hypothetical protein